MPDMGRHARRELNEPGRVEPREDRDHATYAEMVRQVAGCTRCGLYRDATQAVFGEGPTQAQLMLVGEIPGDREDRLGRPFVGPAGRLLDNALERAGLDRSRVYLTNAVKHFKFELQGRRRLHRSPSLAEIKACHYWLERELALIDPHMVLALGATAARAVFGRPVRVLSERGDISELATGRLAMVTVHPSAILRMPENPSRHRAFEEFVADLHKLAEQA